MSIVTSFMPWGCQEIRRHERFRIAENSFKFIASYIDIYFLHHKTNMRLSYFTGFQLKDITEFMEGNLRQTRQLTFYLGKRALEIILLSSHRTTYIIFCSFHSDFLRSQYSTPFRNALVHSHFLLLPFHRLGKAVIQSKPEEWEQICCVWAYIYKVSCFLSQITFLLM